MPGWQPVGSWANSSGGRRQVGGWDVTPAEADSSPPVPVPCLMQTCAGHRGGGGARG